MASLGNPDVTLITGNAPDKLKETALEWYNLVQGRTGTGFGYSIRQRVRVMNISVEPSVDDLETVATRMVCEIEVTPDMCDAQGLLNHGCMVFLMDEYDPAEVHQLENQINQDNTRGSGISLLMLKILKGQLDAQIGVSQAFNIIFHQAAPKAGTILRYISRSISQNDALGIGSCKTEIWDVASHKLLVSGSQLQVKPSK